MFIAAFALDPGMNIDRHGSMISGEAFHKRRVWEPKSQPRCHERALEQVDSWASASHNRVLGPTLDDRYKMASFFFFLPSMACMVQWLQCQSGRGRLYLSSSTDWLTRQDKKW